MLNALEHAQGGEVFIPKIRSYKLKTVLEAVKSITNKTDASVTVFGMRPGEKIHEDMLAKTELPFTYEANQELLVVIPQYTSKSHTYDKKYDGLEYNSSLHLDNEVENLKLKIEEGLRIEG